MRTTVRFEGGRELEQALGGLGTLFRRRKAARDALIEAAEPIRDAAEANAPVRSGGKEKRFRIGNVSKVRQRGALRRHVNIGTRLSRRQSSLNRADKMPVEVYVGTRDRIARLVEFGTKDTPAQPYFRKAWEAFGGQTALDVISAALWRTISLQAQRQARAIARGRK